VRVRVKRTRRLISFIKGSKVLILQFFTEFSSFFFHSSSTDGNISLGVHSLEPVGPCFEDCREGLLSDFVENVGD
jgi:hypothetical protein